MSCPNRLPDICFHADPVHRLVASHGFIVTQSSMESRFHPQADTCIRMALGGSVAGVPTSGKVGVGGHSGGGPEALWIAGSFSNQISALVVQHGAAIAGVNAPTPIDLAKIGMPVLQLCGTHDTTFGCGCGPAQTAYFSKYPPSTPKLLVEAPTDHVCGTEHASGAKFEGPYITAFLSHALLGDPDASSAISAGPQPAGGCTQFGPALPGYIINNML